MIRTATYSDIQRLIELGTLLHSISSYSQVSFDAEKAGRFLAHLIEDKHGVVFVSEKEGVVVGGLAGGITDEWFSNDLVAYDFSVFVEPAHRNGFIAIKLLRAFESWAKAMGAVRVHMGIGTSMHVKGTSELYEALGFSFFGPMFVKEI
ncbi:GNAT family N-acetyltransferase [Metapseudomonas otitidis]|uniref:GNAT family N-acetyltransferase n=1 Tax=Metapseudomonas otitidis TaxID=319939 RepID=UPI002446C753|nr:GNAT family N-acetyltransferase [Pseudomonas otitidis]MDG9783877.1 GNAT family N-acetyltransferase [Pseudomonas otitidis]